MRRERKKVRMKEIYNIAAISFIRKVASVECGDCHFGNLPWNGVKQTSYEETSENHVQNACGPSVSHFYYFFTEKYIFDVDVVWFAINWGYNR